MVDFTLVGSAGTPTTGGIQHCVNWNRVKKVSWEEFLKYMITTSGFAMIRLIVLRFFSFQNLDFFIWKLMALLSVNQFPLYVCVHGELCKTLNHLLVDAEVISV